MANILYCNWCLTARTGTEIVTLETVLGLQRLGHQVAVFLSHTGPSAEQLIQQGIPVMTSLDELPWRPDLIHSNHLPQSLLATVRFPEVPQIYVCHDATTYFSAPPKLPNVKRYFGVDEICADRVRTGSQKVELLPNAVDLQRFRQRTVLPERPLRALLLSKQKEPLDEVKAACEQSGLSLDALGAAFGNEVDNLSERLAEYDIVFAAARNALEAMASGCAVVVMDGRGLAGMVTTAVVDAWRTHNYGKRLLRRPHTTEFLVNEITRYNSADARGVSNRIRQIASLDDYLQILTGIYDSIISENRATPIESSQTMAGFPAGFCAALPDLLPTQPMQEIVSLAASLPLEYNSLWKELSGLSPQITALQAQVDSLSRHIEPDPLPDEPVQLPAVNSAWSRIRQFFTGL